MEERVRTRSLIVPGDTITVDLLSIDKSAYDYFSTLQDILTSNGAATSLAPANPYTNLSNGALGYFAAYTMDRKTIILK